MRTPGWESCVRPSTHPILCHSWYLFLFVRIVSVQLMWPTFELQVRYSLMSKSTVCLHMHHQVPWQNGMWRARHGDGLAGHRGNIRSRAHLDSSGHIFLQNLLNNAVLWLTGWDYSVAIVTTCAWIICHVLFFWFVFNKMLCTMCCWEKQSYW